MTLELYLQTGINQAKLEMAKSKNAGEALLMGRKLAFEETLKFIKENGK